MFNSKSKSSSRQEDNKVFGANGATTLGKQARIINFADTGRKGLFASLSTGQALVGLTVGGGAVWLAIKGAKTLFKKGVAKNG